jgi:chloramphenicol-sensitive protein RarD
VPVYTLAAVLLALNWLIYIWGVNSGQVVETSLGYFINPLVSVLLGVVILRERLRPLQWLPVALAGTGVLYLTLQHGSLPWIALALAFTFGTYGLLKKIAPLGALYGLTLETAILFLPALGYLLFVESRGVGSFGHLSWNLNAVLALSGVVTALPLLMFATAARSIPLSLVGILQYFAPSVQFLLGIFLYREPFSLPQMVGFGIIWTALLIFTLEGLMVRRRNNHVLLSQPDPGD